jgi:hypothetical protein
VRTAAKVKVRPGISGAAVYFVVVNTGYFKLFAKEDLG